MNQKKDLVEQNTRLLSKNKELREALMKTESEKKRLISENIKTVSENETLLDTQGRLREKKDMCVSEIFQHLEYGQKLKECIEASR